MDTKYIVAAYASGENSELFKSEFVYANHAAAALSYFRYLVDKVRHGAQLVDCMKSYIRNTDRVTREMQLYGEIDERPILVTIVITKAAEANGV